MEIAHVATNASRGARKTLILSGVFLASLGTLLFEITLTRLFSVLLSYHFVFIVVAIAMAGLGLGGGLSWRLLRQRDNTGDVPRQLALLSGLCSLSVVLCTILVTQLPGLNSAVLYALAALVPFTLAGTLSALAFGAYAEDSGWLYWADLSGAAIASLLIIPILSLWGAVNAALFISVMLAAASLCFAAAGMVEKRHWLGSGLVVVLLGALFVSNTRWVWLDLDVLKIKADKGLPNLLRDGAADLRVVYTQWDAFSRTDVVESASLPDEKTIFIDGGAGSSMPRFDGNLEHVANLKEDVGFFPFLTGQPPKTLIIGPGGGQDVLLAMLGGSRDITAVEVNPASVAVVRQFGAYNGGLYEAPQVSIVVDEGRSYLRRIDDRYDLVYLSKVNSGVTERAGFALAENYIYTVEAFGDYLSHLSENGVVAIRLHEERDLLRALVTALAALTERGISLPEATQHVVMLYKAGPLGPDAPIELPLLMLKNSPYTPEESRETYVNALAEGFVPLFVPSMNSGVPVAMELAAGRISLDQFIARETTLDLHPPTDERPFFYEFYRSLPQELVYLLLGLGGVALVGAGYLWRQSRSQLPGIGGPALYFAGLGAAYMFVEITMIQRLALFLGHPVVACAVVIFWLLLSSAVASLVTARLERRLPHTAAAFAAAAGLLGILYLALVPAAVSWFLAQALALRCLIAGALIVPLGFTMGVPFPLGLRLVKRTFSGGAVSLMWGVNGIAAVAGSAAAMAIAMQWGYAWDGIAGALIYWGVALIAWVGLARSGVRWHPQGMSPRVTSNPGNRHPTLFTRRR
jgi:hypothetical protein